MKRGRNESMDDQQQITKRIHTTHDEDEVEVDLMQKIEENESLLSGMEARFNVDDLGSYDDMDIFSNKKKITKITTYDLFTKKMEQDMNKDSRETASLVLCLFGDFFRCNRTEFKTNIWRRKALVTRGFKSRFQNLIRIGMFDLDLRSMLENTASDAIHAWLRPLSSERSKRLDSVRTENVDDAIKLHRAGASLYFRASEDLERVMLTNLQSLLGLNFSACYSDGTNRSEIETFVSRKGHCTDWHFDFQQNFTLQLKGKKTWRLALGTYELFFFLSLFDLTHNKTNRNDKQSTSRTNTTLQGTGKCD